MNKLNLKNIWQVPAYLPYLQPELTDDIIQEAETNIGYKFPKEYIDLLKIQNGGYIRYTIKQTGHSQISGIGPYYPSITNLEWSNDYEDLSFDLKDLFPFDGDGHWYICLDYRKNKSEPEIIYIDTESDSENPVAKTFKDYLNLLEFETENEYVIETDAIESTIDQISSILNIEFEEPDYWAHGYAVFRGEFNESLVFITPNIAPSGFIRIGEDRFEELHSLMETTALRFPEVPENSLFISVSDDEQRKIILDTLIKNGIIIKDLKDYF